MFFGARRTGLTISSVPVRTIYEDEGSGINPFTAVPTIPFLIARSYIRRRLGSETRTFISIPDRTSSAIDQ
jgi:hypothetical protein